MNTNATTVRPTAWLLSFPLTTAEQAVQIMKEMSMPSADQRKSGRRPSLSTRRAALAAVMKLKTCSRPLIRVWVSGSVIPIVSRTRVR